MSARSVWQTVLKGKRERERERERKVFAFPPKQEIGGPLKAE